MEVGQVGKYYYPPVIGGVEQHLHTLAAELSKRLKVKVLACNNIFQTEITKENNLEIIKVASIGELFSMPLGFGIPYWLRKLKSEIIHFHLPYPAGVLSYFLVSPQGKVIITWHSDIIRQKFVLPFYKPILKKFLRKAKIIIVSSSAMKNNSPFLQDFKEKIKVIPFGIDLAKFEFTAEIQRKKAEIQKQYGKKIVLFIGRLVPYKGLAYLIKAMKEVEAKLLLIGRGRLKRSLQRLSKEIGVEEKVVFLPPVKEEELPVYYYACNIFVLPSVFSNEAFGIVQLEAMACGKPVISTYLSTGVSFVNQDKKTGLVVPPGDVNALAEAINKLVNNPELSEKYGKCAQERITKEFTKEIMVDKIMKIYEEVCNVS